MVLDVSKRVFRNASHSLISSGETLKILIPIIFSVQNFMSDGIRGGDLVIVQFLEAGFPNKPLHGTSNTVTCTFPIKFCKEIPFSFQTGILTLVAEIDNSDSDW